VLVTTLDEPTGRLQSLIDNGGSRGVAAVLLGHWPAGGTVRVGSDGVVTAASPNILDDLQGTRLFHADATDTRDIIELLTTSPAGPIPEPRSAEDRDDAAAEDTERSETRDAERQPTPPLSRVPSPEHAWLLNVFGHFELLWAPGDGDVVEVSLSPKHRALMMFLAIRPSGSTRHAVREALWPDATGSKPFNAFYATLSQIRKVLNDVSHDHGDEVIEQQGDQVRLNPDLIAVDYWEFADADHASRIATTVDDRFAAWSRIATAYRGKLDSDMTLLWLDAPREQAHCTAVNAITAMAAHQSDPEQRLQLLEHARMLNPHDEGIYRDIIQTHAQLGRTGAIARTIGLLTHTLAEIGNRPSTATLMLARDLQVPGAPVATKHDNTRVPDRSAGRAQVNAGPGRPDSHR
jgi:DNA-binding transcriptional activator of the SARP family